MEATRKKVGRDLTQGSVLQGLLVFAGPIILTNLIQQLYGMVDLMVIGQFVGVTGTVGVATGGEVSDFLTPVATSFATAGQIYIAQLAGAKWEKELKKGIGTFISLMMLMSLALLAATVLLRGPILRALNCPAEAFGQAESYMIITAIGFPFIFGYNAVCGVLRGMGESKRPLLFIIIAAIVNIFLDLLLVVVFPLEAAGTAIATMVSQAASFLAAFQYLYKNREQFGFSFTPSYFKLDPVATRMILNLGIPQACRSILVRVSMLWVNSSVNAYGLVASSTNSVGNKLQKFLEIFTTSFSQAGGAMVGQNLGAEKHDRAKKTVYVCFASSTLVITLITLCVWIWPQQLFGIFTRDADVIAMGVVYLHIMTAHFFISAVTSSFQCMVIGAGNAPLNFVVGVLDGIVCKIGLSLLFVYACGMGVYGYFWGTALSRALPAVICLYYFYSNRWKRQKLLK